MGHHDTAARRRAQRKGREKGLSIYIAAAELEAAGIDPHSDRPVYYRVWPGDHAGFRLRLYREPA
jgi:hypothetical protein